MSRPVSLEGLSRFLVEHEACDAGFDVGHPAGLGNGLISMTCRGCGKAYEYTPGTIEIEREIEFQPIAVPAAAAPPRELLPKSEARPRKPIAAGSKRRRDRIVAAGLLVFAVAAIAFAVFRVLEAREGPAEPDVPATAQPKPEPAQAVPGPDPTPAQQPRAQTQQPRAGQPQTQPPQTQQPQARQPQGSAAGGSAPAATVPSALIAGPGEKEMKMVRFSLIVPEAWTQRAADGGTLIGPPAGAPVSAQVFFEENPAVGIGTMIAESVRFARSRVGGGPVGAVTRTRVGGDPAFELLVRGPGGTEIVRGVLAGSYRYLVVGDAGPAATAAQRADLRRALATFLPI